MTKTFKKSVAFLSAAVMVMAMLLYFPSGTFNIDFGLKASAEEITPSQPTDGDGTSTNPYKIGTAAELYWFAALVNGTLDGVTQNTAAHAKLTANITVNEGVLKSDGTVNSGSFTSWTPIGNSSNAYTGTFDGQNNTISGLYFDDGNTDKVGLFGYVGSGGNVSNVGIVNSYFNGKNHVGGVCGYNYGTIKNCYNTGAVSGSYGIGGVCGNNDGTIQNCYNTGAVSGKWKVGGVCGYNYNSTIQNCYSTGTVSGWSDIGGVCGYNDGSTITNCYFDSDNYGGEAVGHIYSGTITAVEGKTTTQFESGEVCYLLQGGQEKDSGSGEAPMVWGQTIGTDKAPVLTSDSKKTVYLIGVTYSNTNSEITEEEHDFGADFRCKNCGNYEAPELNENVYEITNASQLYWFAEYVKKGNTSAEAILKNNIVVNENVLVENCNLVGDTSKFVSWTPIGNSLKQYTGTFNGNGKTISGLYFDNNGTDYVGLFGYVGSSGNVSNVGVVASYFKGKNNVGGVCGYNYGTIQNCYNTGAVNGSNNVGGVCGNNNGTIKNCYNTGVVSGSDNFGGVCGYNSGGTIENCYFDSNNYGGGAVGSTDGGTITDVEGKTTNAFEKGEVCYLLQSGQEKDSESEEAPMVWGQTIDGQTIDIDKAPVLTSDSAKTVYPKTTGCVTSYSNTNSEITEKAHDFGADFRCTNCGNYEAPELNENVYEITNASQLYWFAKYVNKGNTSAKAILKENIVVNENVLGADGKLVSDTSKFVSWTPIGNSLKQYTGTFNGNGKTISGLYFDNNGTDCVGLFGYVGRDGNVSNVGVVASYFKGKNNVGGVCGYNDGTITNCYNTGAVSGSEFLGGVCGYNYGTIQNCYNTGAVNGSSESYHVGGVCGSNKYSGTITNCYNTGAVSGSEFLGGVCGRNYGTITNCYNTGAVSGSYYVGGVCGWQSSGTIKNCYYLTGTATGGINGTDDVANNVLVKTTTQFTFGEVCYLLNNGTTDGTQVWYQTLDSDSYPLLDNSHGTVYACTPCTGVFSNTEGQHAEHTYIVDTENGKQHICKNCGIDSHNAVFTADDETNTISVCCDLGTVTLKAPTENLTYDGTEKAATVTGVIEGFDTPKILYKLKDSEAAAVETAPVNAGTYVASITYTDADYNEHSVSVEYTIEKAELTVSAGTYKVSKIYDGTKNAGTGSGTLSVSGIINDDVTVKVDSVGEYSASDVGNDYEVAVDILLSGDNESNYTLGTVSSINVPAEITKATPSAPSVPTVSTFDCHSVTLIENEGCEYSMDGETWQDSNVFTGLTAGTKYTFYQRIKATANYEASANSTGVLQTTAEHDYSDENAKPEAFYKKATCTSPAVYYYSCSKCGDVEEDSTHTFTNGSVLDHNDTDNDNRCDTCGHIMDGIGAKLAGYSLSLSGNIGVNFYMELSDEVVADETAYMQFTLPNGEKPQVKVSETEKVTLDNKEYYVFTCEVAAKEMDNTITAQIITSDGEGVAYKYTVRDYADYILDEANGYDDNTKAVVSAMLSYGDYAKAYFSGEELTATSEINAVTSDMLAGYAMTESGILPEGIEYYGSTLLLESETTIRHYFKVTEGTDISAYNMTEKGGYYYIQCSDIPAGSLGTAQDISVGEYTISYSPMSYAYAALNSDSTSDNLKNLVKALYIYYQNAYAYNNSNANAA